jgi:xylan 1,4-beta-xylosidase
VPSGNFTWRDEFDATGQGLSPFWMMLRTPKETWWNLQRRPGHLELTPRADTLSGKDNPSFLGRRVHHATFDASTSFAVPADSRVAAGLALFQTETQHFYLGVRRNGDWMVVFLERWHAGKRDLVANQVVAATDRLELRAKVDRNKASFHFTTPDGTTRTLIADVDSYPLTVQAAGGGGHFTGLVVGPHVRLGR